MAYTPSRYTVANGNKPLITSTTVQFTEIGPGSGSGPGPGRRPGHSGSESEYVPDSEQNSDTNAVGENITSGMLLLRVC